MAFMDLRKASRSLQLRPLGFSWKNGSVLLGPPGAFLKPIKAGHDLHLRPAPVAFRGFRLGQIWLNVNQGTTLSQIWGYKIQVGSTHKSWDSDMTHGISEVLGPYSVLIDSYPRQQVFRISRTMSLKWLTIEAGTKMKSGSLLYNKISYTTSFNKKWLSKQFNTVEGMSSWFPTPKGVHHRQRYIPATATRRGHNTKLKEESCSPLLNMCIYSNPGHPITHWE